MGERDAFGREIGEDTLKEMGWSPSAPPPRTEPGRTEPPQPKPAPSAFDAGEAWKIAARQAAPKPEPAPPEPAAPLQWPAAPAQRPEADGPAAPLQWPAPDAPAVPSPLPARDGAAAPPQWRAPDGAAAPPQGSAPDGATAPPQWSAPDGAAAPPPKRYLRRHQRGFSRLLFLLVLIVIVAASAGSLIKLGSDAVDGALRDAIPTPGTSAPDVRPSESLLRTAPLRKALAQLPKGRVTMLSLNPSTLDATVASGGKISVVHITADGDVTKIASPAGIPSAGVKVNPAAPARIVRTITRRTGRDGAAVYSLVLISVSGAPAWNVTLDDGTRFSANASGTKVRRVG